MNKVRKGNPGQNDSMSSILHLEHTADLEM